MAEYMEDIQSCLDFKMSLVLRTQIVKGSNKLSMLSASGQDLFKGQ